MRALRYAIVVAAPIVVLAAGCGSTRKIDLESGVKEGKVEASFQCKGTYGDIVVVALKLKSGERTEVAISPGTILKNNNPAQESLAIRKYRGRPQSVHTNKFDPNSTLLLTSSKGDDTGILECYSLNALAPPGGAASTYTVDGHVPDKLLRVIEAMQDGETIMAKQGAVWAITDNLTHDQMRKLIHLYMESDFSQTRKILTRAKLDPMDFKLFEGRPK